MPTTTITLTNNDDILDLGGPAGNQTVVVTFGLDGNDSIIGVQGDDLIYGGNGADTITSNFAVLTPTIQGDTIYGGAGDDVITTVGTGGNTSSIGDLVYGGTGNDSILGAVNSASTLTNSRTGLALDVDFLYGGAGNDTIDGNGGEDFIFAGDGDDLVLARDESDTTDGGAGIDTIDFSNRNAGGTPVNIGSVIFDMASGATTAYGDVESNINYENAIGSAANDTITGNASNNSINGGDGDDTLAGAEGSDTFVTGAGDDSVVGGDEGGDTDVLDYSDLANGVTVSYTGDEAGTAAGIGTGTDTFAEIERVIFTDADDAVNASNDTVGVTLDMGAGNDFVEAGQGADVMDGGDGIDTLSYEDSAAPVTLDLESGTGTGGNAEGDSFVNFENFTLTDGDDSVDGSSGNDSINALDGADTIDGAGGDDSVDAGAGNDVVAGGAGADSMDGGAGIDTLDYSGSAAPVTVDLEAGTANGGDGTGDTFVNFENVTGTDGGDNLAGSSVANTIDGGGGDDLITAGDGDDSVIAGTGNDVVQGGAGDDSMDGGDGIDTLDLSDATSSVTVDMTAGTATGADTGDDTFINFEGATGGSGDDTLIGDSGDNTLDGGAGNDRIDGGDGDDTLRGDLGDDLFIIGRGTGDDSVTGGEDPGDGDNDVLRIVAQTGDDVDVLYAGGDDEEGTVVITDSGGNTISTIDFAEIETIEIVCFARGTMIETPDGEVAVEDLAEGDMVVTRDHGPQQIRWIKGQTVPAVGKLAPVTIKAGTLGNDRDLVVSPQHRMLIEDWRAELMFGEPEVLAAAKHLVNGDTIFTAEGDTVEYFHVLFDEHQIVRSNGAWSESFHPGASNMTAMEQEIRDEVFAIFPELEADIEGYGPSARPSLKGWEARALRR